MVSYPKFIARALFGFNKKGKDRSAAIACLPNRRSGKARRKGSSKKSKRRRKKRKGKSKKSDEPAMLLTITANTTLLSDDDDIWPTVQMESKQETDFMSRTSRALETALHKATDYAKFTPDNKTIQYGPFDGAHKGVRDIDISTLPNPLPNTFRYRFSRTPVLKRTIPFPYKSPPPPHTHTQTQTPYIRTHSQNHCPPEISARTTRLTANPRPQVQRPTVFDPEAVTRSAQLPLKTIELERVFGYEGAALSSNVFSTATGKVAYYVAGTGVVMDPATRAQSFFVGHTDDITCMAMHPNGCLLVTGQMGVEPHMCVWEDTAEANSGNLCTLHAVVGYYLPEVAKYANSHMRGSTKAWQSKKKMHGRLPRQPFYHNQITAVSFAGAVGQYLVAAGADDNHTIGVWNWLSGKLLAQAPAFKAQPPSLFGVVNNPYVRTPGAIEFVTLGVHHIRFWQFTPQPATREVPAPTARDPLATRKVPLLVSLKCSYSQSISRAPKGMLSAVFVPTKTGDGQCLSGGSDGCVYVWKHAAIRPKTKGT